ncbi:MAG: DUF721 domain-containing protein [Candidatus Loosdrechtia sp.]|uniref:DUF721 domain-containing protein n=1 Tax=Candidatus Loosdrechtia sp. TaxID=3101272 RepID=UPI003A6A4E4E|nr:MAG: DUF721 domain-containing protein [Candidatus Jettenia sp. AMX2]
MRGELPERYFSTRDRIVKIGKILKESFPKRRGQDKTVQQFKEVWKHVVNDDICTKTAITGFKSGILYVTVESSVMIHYLTNFKKTAIIDELNNKIGRKYIQDIRFKTGVL